MEFSRRSFLTGSALFIAVPFLAAADQQSAPQEKGDTKGSKGSLDSTGEEKSSLEKTYTDKDGNLYRICPQCGSNMYKEGKMWVCSVCGYAYVE